MAELHIIGQLASGTGFRAGSSLFCKFHIECGASWKVLGGAESGQTQSASATRCLGSEKGQWFWSHPIDVHFATKGVQGWPKIVCQVFHLDVHGRCVLEGYGVSNFPMAPGLHQLSIHCWKPRTSSLKDQLSETFLGGSVILKNPHVASSPEDRYKLKTASSGTVNIEVNVVARNFSKFGVQLG